MRIVINADLNEERDPDVALIRSQVMVEYGPEELGGKTYICPQRSFVETRRPRCFANLFDRKDEGAPSLPACGEFTQTSGSQKCTFPTLNTGQYSWAVLRSYFFTKLDAVYAMNAYSVNSAYRNPAKEYAIAGSAKNYHPGSRHEYGDAEDINTSSSTWQTVANDGHSLGACVKPVSVQNSYGHAHLDWRTWRRPGRLRLNARKAGKLSFDR
jgi:hypothetical protein